MYGSIIESDPKSAKHGFGWSRGGSVFLFLYSEYDIQVIASILYVYRIIIEARRKYLGFPTAIIYSYGWTQIP
jgi:hypothetical protein